MPTSITGENGVSQVQNNTITQADLTTAVLPLGVGQSLSNMTAVRTFGTAYPNDTGRPIVVYVNIQWSSGAGASRLTIGAAHVDGPVIAGSLQTSPVWFVVPAGATYTLSGTGSLGYTILTWNELRS